MVKFSPVFLSKTLSWQFILIISGNLRSGKEIFSGMFIWNIINMESRSANGNLNLDGTKNVSRYFAEILWDFLLLLVVVVVVF